MAKMSDSITIEVKVKMIADFSIFQALKLRLAGAKYLEEFIKAYLEKAKIEEKTESHTSWQ